MTCFNIQRPEAGPVSQHIQSEQVELILSKEDASSYAYSVNKLKLHIIDLMPAARCLLINFNPYSLISNVITQSFIRCDAEEKAKHATGARVCIG